MDICSRKNNSKVEILQFLTSFDEVTVNLNPPYLIKGCLEFIADNLHLFGAYVLVLTEDKSGFKFLYASDSIKIGQSNDYISLEDTETSKLIKQKNPLYRPNISICERKYKFNKKLINAGILSVFTIPLFIGSKTIGVMNFCSTKVEGISDESRQVLRVLAPRLSQVIQLSLLYRKLHESKERLSVIRKFVNEIAHNFNNNLSSIIGNTDIIRESVKDDTLLIYHTNNILNSVNHSAELIKKLVDVVCK